MHMIDIPPALPYHTTSQQALDVLAVGIAGRDQRHGLSKTSAANGRNVKKASHSLFSLCICGKDASLYDDGDKVQARWIEDPESMRRQTFHPQLHVPNHKLTSSHQANLARRRADSCEGEESAGFATDSDHAKETAVDHDDTVENSPPAQIMKAVRAKASEASLVQRVTIDSFAALQSDGSKSLFWGTASSSPARYRNSDANLVARPCASSQQSTNQAALAFPGDTDSDDRQQRKRRRAGFVASKTGSPSLLLHMPTVDDCDTTHERYRAATATCTLTPQLAALPLRVTSPASTSSLYSVNSPLPEHTPLSTSEGAVHLPPSSRTTPSTTREETRGNVRPLCSSNIRSSQQTFLSVDSVASAQSLAIDDVLRQFPGMNDDSKERAAQLHRRNAREGVIDGRHDRSDTTCSNSSSSQLQCCTSRSCAFHYDCCVSDIVEDRTPFRTPSHESMRSDSVPSPPESSDSLSLASNGTGHTVVLPSTFPSSHSNLIALSLDVDEDGESTWQNDGSIYKGCRLTVIDASPPTMSLDYSWSSMRVPIRRQSPSKSATQLGEDALQAMTESLRTRALYSGQQGPLSPPPDLPLPPTPLPAHLIAKHRRIPASSHSLRSHV